MLLVILYPPIMQFIDKLVGTGHINIKMGDIPTDAGVKKPIPFPMLLQYALFIYAIFLPLKLGTTWFYSGLAIYTLGELIFLNAMITAVKTPSGKLFSLGMYHYSRHPMYLSLLFTFVGISVSSASWLFLLFSMGWMIFPLSQVNHEERECAEAFGSEYQEYIRKTPKWLGIPKSR